MINKPIFIGFILPLIGTICIPFIKLKIRHGEIKDFNLKDWDIGIDFAIASVVILIVESINIQRRELPLDPTREQILMNKYMIVLGLALGLLIILCAVWIVKWIIGKYFTTNENMKDEEINKRRYKYGSYVVSTIYGFLCSLVVLNILTAAGGYM
ncbi:hypothetical protein [Planococcus beijingensis]|uniref:hypothetical protein n=1 Tax=Planococcus beijingensis TaxID=2782551 RepID=UPI00193C59BC|nr:hypothetical protein [Planococcus beijingensis]